MIRDKYSALWVSYSSMTDYLRCPRAYFLKNIYRNPKNRRKIQLIQPALALGQIIHDVIDELSFLPLEDRLRQSLKSRFNKAWGKISGKKGGFSSDEEENKFKDRGLKMIDLLEKNPGPILKKSIKIRQ